MTSNHFYKSLSLVSVLSLILLYCYSEVFSIESFFGLGFYSFFIFLGLTLIVFKVAKKIIVHPNRTKFISFIISNMLLKMIVTVATVLIYFKTVKPTSQYFIVPFLTVYLIFTIFETYFLLKVANEKQ
jgi:hypothetical protein